MPTSSPRPIPGGADDEQCPADHESIRGGNPDLGFVKRKEFNAGLNATLFSGLLRLNANFFNVDINDHFTIDSNTFPSYFMTYWPIRTSVPTSTTTISAAPVSTSVSTWPRK